MNRYLWPGYKRPYRFYDDINIGDKVYWDNGRQIGIVYEIIGEVFHIHREGIDPTKVKNWANFTKERLRKA